MLLQNELPHMLEIINPNIIQCIWIQQDSAPLHFARIETNFLNLTYNNVGLDEMDMWLGHPDRLI